VSSPVDVLVIGAGLVGAACAYMLASAGLSVCVTDRTGPAAGTTAGGEGNLLVSDKLPGPEAELAMHSVSLWRSLAGQAGPGAFEFEPKGGLVVAWDSRQLAPLLELAAAQRADGVIAEPLDPDELLACEPAIARDLAGCVWYPQDCQVQPVLAAAWLLREAVRLGARTAFGSEVLSALVSGGDAIAGVVTSAGPISAGAVVNAAGPWSGEVAARLGGWLPVKPRRGHVLVTEPLPPLIRHKVYEADYVGTVVSDEPTAAYSGVVEATKAGTVLIGSSREFAGWDRTPSIYVMASMARRAVRMFPGLGEVRAIRCYTGFRPASPDHLPLIGPDTRVPGLYHASGHEGAGIGLAPATAELIAGFVTGSPPAHAGPFIPARLAS
jgi:glycine/D-amino acid oxidase-like deaminating enzyme